MEDKELADSLNFQDVSLLVIFYLGEDLDHEKLTFFNTNYPKAVPINNKQELQIGIVEVNDKDKKAIELMKLMKIIRQPGRVS